MTINAITSNPKILGNLKQAIGAGTGAVENVVSTNENISTQNIDNIVNLTLNNDVSITTLDLSNVLLNGNYGISGEILMSQGLEDNIWAPMPIIPDIPDTLISNSLYVNDGINTIQSKIDISNQADVIYISAGSYGEQQIKIDGKYNMALCAPPIGTSAICEVLNGINITNTSELIRVSNLSIKGSDSFINPIGRCIFHNVTFTGSVLDPLDIEIGDSTTKYLTFNQCEWNQYCNITIPSTFASVIYFVNCNFSSAVINLLNFSNQQVIFNNCAGFVSYPLATKATLIGLNVLATGVSRVDAANVNLATINNLAYPPTINLNSDANSVLYSVNGSDIKGNNNILKFEEDIKKLTVSESMSYVSAYPIGVETANNDNTFFTGVLAQNKNSSDGSSTHLLITNNLGSDNAFYGGLDMFSSNSTVQYDQFGTMPNALGLSSQSSSIVITPNAGNSEDSAQNNNIILCYDNGTKALIINDNGQLVVGADNPSYSGNTYGGDDGGVNKVLTSNGASGLKWTPLGGLLKQFYYLSDRTPEQTAETIDIGTPVQLSFDITKYYKITVIYNFNVVGGGSGVSQCTFALRDNDDNLLQQMEMNLSKPHQAITIIFYVQPLLASSNLYFVASSPDHIENAYDDRIIWDIQEVQ
jgi:hypothetical protein